MALVDQLLPPLPDAMPRFIFLHMAAVDWAPDEFPYIRHVEERLSSLSLFVSEEAREKQTPYFEQMPPHAIYPNPTATGFAQAAYEPRERPESVLIVSNHAPKEVKEARRLLADAGVRVSHIGIGGDRQELVTPEVMSDFDVVISIGKTIQYCLVGGRPAYVYDHFGGFGYLDDTTLDLARTKNYSGRGGTRRTPEVIADEIMSGYAEAVRFHAARREGFVTDYSIDQVVPRILDLAQPREIEPFDTALHHVVRSAETFGARFYRYWGVNAREARELKRLRSENRRLRQKVDRLNQQAASLRAKVGALRGEIDRLVGTWSFRVGRAIVRPASAVLRGAAEAVRAKLVWIDGDVTDSSAPPGAELRAAARGVQRWFATRRAPTLLVGLLVVLVTLIAAFPTVMPVNVLIVPLLLATLFLPPRHLVGFVLLEIVAVGIATARQTDFSERRWLALAIIFGLAIFALVISLRRSRLGVAGAEGAALLVDLRDRIQSQGSLPALIEGWAGDARVRSAGGTPFSGDFFCFRQCTAQRLEVVLVDVSGKGAQAGARALQLSGALNGLLGAVPPAELIPAVNQFLLRQEWGEDFATAVHLSLDLRTGQYDVYNAGHPPPLIVDPSGVRRIEDGGGPLLGLIADAAYPPAGGELLPGEAIVLYTDGLVEVAGVDLDAGIDRLGRIVDGQLDHGVGGMADRVIDATGALCDDRALLVLRRS